jgi:hypothetical protein
MCYIIGPRSWTQARACILLSFFCMVFGTFLVVYKWWCELPHNFSRLSRDRFTNHTWSHRPREICLCAALHAPFSLTMHYAKLTSIISSCNVRLMIMHPGNINLGRALLDYGHPFFFFLNRFAPDRYQHRMSFTKDPRRIRNYKVALQLCKEDLGTRSET